MGGKVSSQAINGKALLNVILYILLGVIFFMNKINLFRLSTVVVKTLFTEGCALLTDSSLKKKVEEELSSCKNRMYNILRFLCIVQNKKKTF